jgi:hypothetical protein
MLGLTLLAAGFLAGLQGRPRLQRGGLPLTSLSQTQIAAVRPYTLSAPAPGKAFHWSQVESSDYDTYITKLRAIGCPEQTVRDIIVADVNQLFAPRYAALSETAPELAWWRCYNRRKPARPELTARLRELDGEKNALVERLLGGKVPVDFPLTDSTVATLREQSAFAFLPESKRNAVREVASRYQALEEWGEAQWKGLPTDESDAKRKGLADARSHELAALLSPEEMRQFDLRNSATSNTLREQYGLANLTEEEFRKLYDLRRDFEQRNPEPKREDWTTLEAGMATALGPERFAEIQRQNDSMWRAMQTIAVDERLNADAIQQACTIQREFSERMVQAVGRMFADPDQNPQPLRDLSDEMEGQLVTVLGETAVRRLNRLDALPRLVSLDDGKRKIYSLSPGAFNE